MPLALQSCVDAGPIGAYDCACWGLWCLSFVWEHTADLQKVAFAREMKRQGLRKRVCDWGNTHSLIVRYFWEALFMDAMQVYGITAGIRITLASGWSGLRYPLGASQHCGVWSTTLTKQTNAAKSTEPKMRSIIEEAGTISFLSMFTIITSLHLCVRAWLGLCACSQFLPRCTFV